MKQRLLKLAHYNAWATEALWDGLDGIDDASFEADRKAFFRSLSGTLNHILLASRIWLDRCEGRELGWFKSLDQRLEAGRQALRRQMAGEDARLIAFVRTRDDAALGANAVYKNTAGESFRTPLHWVVSHMINHATHHRGQATDILSGLRQPTPELDLIYYLRQQGYD